MPPSLSSKTAEKNVVIPKLNAENLEKNDQNQCLELFDDNFECYLNVQPKSFFQRSTSAEENIEKVTDSLLAEHLKEYLDLPVMRRREEEGRREEKGDRREEMRKEEGSMREEEEGRRDSREEERGRGEEEGGNLGRKKGGGNGKKEKKR